MESLWTWLSTPPGKGEVLDPFGVFCLAPLCPRVCDLGVPRGTWRGSTGERSGSARWSQVQVPRSDCGCSAPAFSSLGLGSCRSTHCHSANRNGCLAASWPSFSPPPAASIGGERIIQRNWHAASPRTPSIHSPISGAASAARRPGKRFRKRRSGDRRRHAERPALVHERGVQDWPCTSCRSRRSGLSPVAGSGQASPRHPGRSVYGCYLPVLTGFAVPRRAGPFRQRRVPSPVPKRRTSKRSSTPLRRVAGTGHRQLPI